MGRESWYLQAWNAFGWPEVFVLDAAMIGIGQKAAWFMLQRLRKATQSSGAWS